MLFRSILTEEDSDNRAVGDGAAVIDDVLRPAAIQASGVVQEGLCVCRDVQGRKEVPCRGASSCTSSAMAASARQGNHDARQRRARARGERREARLAAGVRRERRARVWVRWEAPLGFAL